jgi:8-oxo-dGTP diphosphatase
MKKGIIEIIVRLIIKRGDKVLLCQNVETGHYYLPGGHVEFGENFEYTIHREMKEELGLEKEEVFDIKPISVLENSWEEEGGLRHEINHIFEAKINDKLELSSKEDLIRFDWVDKDSLGEINFLPESMISIAGESHNTIKNTSEGEEKNPN